MNLADSLNTQVVEALKGAEKRHEDSKKRQMQYFQKLLSDRDKAYNDRLKVCNSTVPHLVDTYHKITGRQSKRLVACLSLELH